MLLGALAGDMIGSPYEFGNIKTTDFPLFIEDSHFTDDSVMTLAIADGLMEAAEDIQPITYSLVLSMRRLGQKYPNAGYGAKFADWLEDSMNRPFPYRSWGNGAGMRVSPVAWAYDSLDLVEFVAAETAKATHNSVEGVRGAQAIAGCTYLARIGKGDDEIRGYVRNRIGYALDFTLDGIRANYEFDVSCQGSVPQAIEAFLESDGFEDAVRKAVSIGGDSDTIGAMTASIAQGRYGVPDEIEKVVRTLLPEDLLEINDRFCTLFDVR